MHAERHREGLTSMISLMRARPAPPGQARCVQPRSVAAVSQRMGQNALAWTWFYLLYLLVTLVSPQCTRAMHV